MHVGGGRRPQEHLGWPVVGQGAYLAEIDTLDGGAIVPLDDWYVYENRQGWYGFGTVDPGGGGFMPTAQVLKQVLDYGIHPEAPVALGLWVRSVSPPEDESGAGAAASASASERQLTSVRTWPAMVTEVGAPAGNAPSGNGGIVLFSDPIRYLLHERIWGAWKDATPGEILGAALSLAIGGDGRPTLSPALPGMPPLKIAEALSDSVPDMPYVIAAGEPLGYLLARLFGRLGIRIELLGAQDGHIDVHLRDSPPDGNPVAMTLLPGITSATNAAIDTTAQQRHPDVRGVLYDGIDLRRGGGGIEAALGEAQRLGEDTDAVGDLLYGVGLDREEAEYLAGFEDERADLDMNAVRVVTGQPGLHPGRLVTFSNRTISGANTWQVARVWHGAADGRYRNTVDLVKAGMSWRPSMPPPREPVTITGIVDDGKSAPGALISRDRLGRIPVTMAVSVTGVGEDVEVSPQGGELPASPSFDNVDPGNDGGEGGGGEGDGDGGGEGDGDDPAMLAPPPVELDLHVVEPMAGGRHGFVVNHRQGDVCRVSVHHPMWAEVTGFSFAYDKLVGENLVDVSAGMVVGNVDEKWSGMLFKPEDDAREDDVDTVEEWRSVKGRKP